MNTKRAIRMMYDVAHQFNLFDRMEDELEQAQNNEATMIALGMRLGLSEKDLENSIPSVPNALYKQYSLFQYLNDWELAETLSSPYAPDRFLKCIFGNKWTDSSVPTIDEERKALATSVRARCDQKVLQINELFPNTYPLHLPVWKFHINTCNFISFKNVYAMIDSWDEVLQRFSTLFFAAVKGDLPEREALELNLLSSFFAAFDCIMPHIPITYQHIQKYRAQMQHEGFHQLTSYVRIHKIIPFWQAREFYFNTDALTHYVEHHNDTKATIRSFLCKISNFECHYTFILDSKKHDYIQSLTDDEFLEYGFNCLGLEDDDTPSPYMDSEHILIEKTAQEIDSKDRFIAEQGKRLLKSIHFSSSVSKAEHFNPTARQMYRMGINSSLPESYIHPLPISDVMQCNDTYEGGIGNDAY